MKKWEKYNYILRNILYIVFLIDIISRIIGNTKGLIIFIAILFFAIINDYLRYNYLYKYSNSIYYISILISIFIGGVLNFFVGGYAEIYLYIILVNIAFIKDRKAVMYLYTLNILVIIFVPLLRISSLEGIGIYQLFRENLFDYLMIFVLLFFSTTTIFSYRALLIEKNRVEKLNREIEKLTITKERNRVAQEIHDNLGHNLVALNMNLDVANNMIDEENNIKEIIEKCQSLTKDSMDSLRKAVYALKDEDISERLIKSIEKLTNNIVDGSNININYNIDEKIETYSPEYKNIIYTIIKEGITNSINHGECNEIIIDVKVEDKIYLTIKDNGIGCSEIIKGNGLKGIEERISKVGGEIEYMSKKGEGFGMVISLSLSCSYYIYP